MARVKKVDSEKGKNKMEEVKSVTISVKVSPDLKARLDEKLGQVPVSIITRELWEKWLDEEITVELIKSKKA